MIVWLTGKPDLVRLLRHAALWTSLNLHLSSYARGNVRICRVQLFESGHELQIAALQQAFQTSRDRLLLHHHYFSSIRRARPGSSTNDLSASSTGPSRGLVLNFFWKQCLYMPEPKCLELRLCCALHARKPGRSQCLPPLHLSSWVPRTCRYGSPREAWPWFGQRCEAKLGRSH